MQVCNTNLKGSA